MLSLASTLSDRTCIYDAYAPSSFQSHQKNRKIVSQQNEKENLKCYLPHQFYHIMVFVWIYYFIKRSSDKKIMSTKKITIFFTVLTFP